MHEARRASGLALTCLSVLGVAGDAVMTRLMELQGATSLATLGAKATITGTLTLLAATWLDGGTHAVITGLMSAPWHALAAAILQGAVQAGFTLSFLLTDPARALLMTNLNPLWAALAGKVFLGDILPGRTVGALALAFLSVGVIFIPDIFAAPAAKVTSASTLPGDFCALATGVSLAGYLTVIRHAALRRPEAKLTACAGLGALGTGGIALAVVTARTPNVLASLPPPFWAIAVLDGAGISSSVVFMNLALLRITGTEVALIFLSQVPIAPFLAYLVLGLVPSSWTVGGGSALLAVLALHEVLGMAASSSHHVAPDVPLPSRAYLAKVRAGDPLLL